MKMLGRNIRQCVCNSLRIVAGLVLTAGLVVAAGMSSSLAEARYTPADASYVTTSRNIDVLDYIVCLEAAVNRSPEAMPLAQSLRTAAGSCREAAKKLPKLPGEPQAVDIVDSIRECGFFPEQASPDADCARGPKTGMQAPAPDDGAGDTLQNDADTVERKPAIIDVGKWAEGIAFDGNSLWVAESGDRSIAKVDLKTMRVKERRKVGRLPVNMASDGDGVVYTLVVTDKLIKKQTAKGAGSTLTKLGECPETMWNGGSSLWVVTLPSCSSEKSRLIRVDASKGKQRKSGTLGEWATSLVGQGEDIFIAHARAPALTIVDQSDLESRAVDIESASLWAITANDSNVFAGGVLSDDDAIGVVVMIDPRMADEIARAEVTERIAKMTSNEDEVIAVGAKGTIWVYSASDLALLRTITSSTGEFEPRDVLLVDERLMISVGTFKGDNGAVFMFDDWSPSANAKGGAKKRPVATAPIEDKVPTPRVKPSKPVVGQAPGLRKKVTISRAGYPVNAGSWGGNIRKGPGISAKWLRSIPEGEPVRLLGRTSVVMNGYPWFQLQLRNNVKAYMWGGLLCSTGRSVAGIAGDCTFGTSKPKRPPVADRADIASLLGTYRHSPAQTDWHTGNIERDGSKLRWTNFAGVSWTLTPDFASDRLETGRDNPLFKKGIREFKLIRDHGDVIGFQFGRDSYFRTSNVQILIAQPPPGNNGGGKVRQRKLVVNPGAGAAVASDGIPRGSRDAYRIFAKAGEVLTVSVSALDDNAVFEIRDGDVKGRSLSGAAPGNDARFWSGVAPRDGDYIVIVGPVFGGTDYTLSVSLDEDVMQGSDGEEDDADLGEDPRAKGDYSMLAAAEIAACSGQFNERTSQFFDCLDDARALAMAARPDPRMSVDYFALGLANGAFQTCAVDQVENTPAYFDCLDGMVLSAGGTLPVDGTVDPRINQDYSMLADVVRDDCRAIHGDNTKTFFDCMEQAKAEALALAPAPAPAPDPRMSTDYFALGLGNGAFQTCAAQHDENTSPYFDCLDEMVASSATVPSPPSTDPRAGKDYSMLDHDVRDDCSARLGNGTSGYYDCLDQALAAAPAPAADPRMSTDYFALGLGNGAFQTCAAQHGENSSPYFDCLDGMVASGGPVAPTDPADSRVGKDYSMIADEVRNDCGANFGEGTSSFFDCMDSAIAAGLEEEADRQAQDAANQAAQDAANQAAQDDANQAAQEAADQAAQEEADRQAQEAADQAAQDAANQAAQDAANQAAQDDANQAAQEAADQAAQEEADRQAQEAADQAAQDAANQAAQDAANQAAQDDANQAAQEAAGQAAQEEADRQAQEAANQAAQDAANQAAQDAANQAAQDDANQAAQEAADQAAQEEADRQAQEAADQAAQEEADRQAQEAADQAAQEAVDQAAQEEADRQAQEAADQAAQEEADRQAQEPVEEEFVE